MLFPNMPFKPMSQWIDRTLESRLTRDFVVLSPVAAVDWDALFPSPKKNFGVYIPGGEKEEKEEGGSQGVATIVAESSLTTSMQADSVATPSRDIRTVPSNKRKIASEHSNGCEKRRRPASEHWRPNRENGVAGTAPSPVHVHTPALTHTSQDPLLDPELFTSPNSTVPQPSSSLMSSTSLANPVPPSASPLFELHMLNPLPGAQSRQIPQSRQTFATYLPSTINPNPTLSQNSSALINQQTDAKRNRAGPGNIEQQTDAAKIIPGLGNISHVEDLSASWENSGLERPSGSSTVSKQSDLNHIPPEARPIQQTSTFLHHHQDDSQYSWDPTHESSGASSTYGASQTPGHLSSLEFDPSASNLASSFNEYQPSLYDSGPFTYRGDEFYLTNPPTGSSTKDPFLLAGGYEGYVPNPSHTPKLDFSVGYGHGGTPSPDEAVWNDDHQQMDINQPQPPPNATPKPTGHNLSQSLLIRRSLEKKRVDSKKQERISPRSPPSDNDGEIDEGDFDFTFTKFRKGERILMNHQTLSKYRCYPVTETDLNVLGGVNKLRPGPSKLRYSTTIISNAKAMWLRVLERELKSELEADAEEVRKSGNQAESKKRRTESDDKEKSAKKSRQK